MRLLHAPRFALFLSMLMVQTASAHDTGLGAEVDAEAVMPVPVNLDSVPRVLVSIRPLHSIIANVMNGLAEPALLLDGIESPHTLSLKPSQAQRLQETELLIWVGAALEPQLPKYFEALSKEAITMEMMAVPYMELLSTRDAALGHLRGHGDGSHGELLSQEQSAHEHGDQSAEDSVDPHLWLDPRNAARLAEQFAETLAQMDPTHAPYYRHNAAHFSARVADLDWRWDLEMKLLQGRGFMVQHDATQYFEQRYGLEQTAALSLQDDRPASAARLKNLERLLEDHTVGCILVDTSADHRVVAALEQPGRPLQQIPVDVLGLGYEPGPELYIELFNAVGESFKQCLSKAP